MPILALLPFVSMTVRQARSQQTVLNLLRELQQEIDAQDLHLELRRRGQKMGLATVYRALKFLHKEGLIQERPSTHNLYTSSSLALEVGLDMARLVNSDRPSENE